MGQAKQRGTKQERIIQALQQRYSTSNLNITTVEDICKQYDVPMDSKPIGYVIAIADISEFLSVYQRDRESIVISFSPHPINAKVFDDFNTLVPVAQHIAIAHETDICFMFDTDNQLQVIPVISVDRTQLN